jgi:hypothetical protein
VKLTGALLIVGTLDLERAILLDDVQHGRDVALELALGAADGDVAATDGNVNAGWDGDGHAADS